MMIAVLCIVTLIAVGYQLASLMAVRRLWIKKTELTGFVPRVSILKPVHGLDENFAEAIESHASQEYPEFEILFGVHSMDDAAIPAIQKLIADHPERRIELIHCPPDPEHPAANAKVGTLSQLIGHARHEVLLVNDSDILVPRYYLRDVVEPLNDGGRGLVTCVYRATANSAAGRWEALGIATDFIPSTLVAPMVGVKEFGLGSTLVFRRADLEAIGGFDALRDYIADDYQLARRITGAGKRAHLSPVVVETHLGRPGFAAMWRHQVRWARTIRVSRGDGYIGLPVTHAGVWSLLCLVLGLLSIPPDDAITSPLGQLRFISRDALSAHGTVLFAGMCAVLIGLVRISTALASSLVLRDASSFMRAWLAPLWDLFAFVVWIAGWMGSTITWRGARMRLTRDGRLVPPGQ